MNTLLEEALNIRYVKLEFTIELPEDCTLPESKASMFRGGIGEMLLRTNCIKDRDCDKCGFRSECIVQRTMYSQFEIHPAFSTRGDSAGYVLRCENWDTYFEAGDRIDFQLILFGKSIVYFGQYMQAIFMLGQSGIAKDKVRYNVVSVKNTYGEDILEGSNVYMGNYKIETVHDYVMYRRKMLGFDEYSGDKKIEIYFNTPWTQKYNGEFLKELNIDALLKAAVRRAYILDCFEGIDSKFNEKFEYGDARIVSKSEKEYSVARYSNRQKQHMNLNGIRGTMTVENLSDDEIDILLAGEIMHVGKNTSFGFGRYVIGI